ncbi:SGNH hydrolase-type esterase domain-containing protein [Aspergillus ambiguus]|uniref:SGNH hydrolase-type esterase domain-containing protein n=1 Tax=Aspergillus ambiguus TaxID=176160 RepID=UPI003CCE2D1E
MAKLHVSANLFSNIFLPLLLVDLISGYAIYNPDNVSPFAKSAALSMNTSLFAVDSHNPDGGIGNTAWITRWAAIGDSFTAGIGAGNLWSNDYEDVKCSRYDKSYIGILDHVFGDSVRHFQYVACSGARTSDILEQAKALAPNLNLVVMTAGGNDLCLSDVIKTCIFLPYFRHEGCQNAIKKAEENIDTILKPNIREILKEINNKMAKKSVVVYAGYAQYFYDDDKDDDCTFKQDFTFPKSGLGYKMTLEDRRKFNSLVTKTNQAINEVVDEFRENRDGLNYLIRFADWDPWPRHERIAGQMCWPKSTGRVPDPNQPNLQFFKPATDTPERELKRRDELSLNLVEKSPNRKGWKERLYNSILYKSVNPFAEALARLTRRGAISPPRCPTDDDWDIGFGLPDRWGKFFHPNELGHTTLASFVMNALLSARTELMGESYGVCKVRDSFHCFEHNRESLAKYISPSFVDETYTKFCAELYQQETPNWIDERIFNEGSHEAHKYTVQLRNGAIKLDKEECLDSFKHLIYSCDMARDPNPHGWKHGGTYQRGSYTYKLESVSPHSRPWPLEKPTGKCEGWYKGLFGSYTVRGAGWVADNGQKLADSIKSCWLDKPDRDGMEWKATFRTPIWTRLRCFNNNNRREQVALLMDATEITFGYSVLLCSIRLTAIIVISVEDSHPVDVNISIVDLA